MSFKLGLLVLLASCVLQALWCNVVAVCRVGPLTQLLKELMLLVLVMWALVMLLP